MLNKTSYTSGVLHLITSILLIGICFFQSSQLYGVVCNSIMPLFVFYSLAKIFLDNLDLSKYKNISFVLLLIASTGYASLNFDIFSYISNQFKINYYYVSAIGTLLLVFLSLTITKKKIDRNYLVSLIMVIILSIYSLVTTLSINNVINTKIEFYEDVASSQEITGVNLGTTLARFKSKADSELAISNTIKSMLNSSDNYNSLVIVGTLSESLNNIQKNKNTRISPFQGFTLNLDYKNEVLPIVIINEKTNTFILDTTTAKDVYIKDTNIKNQFVTLVFTIWMIFLFATNMFHHIFVKRRAK